MHDQLRLTIASNFLYINVDLTSVSKLNECISVNIHHNAFPRRFKLGIQIN